MEWCPPARRAYASERKMEYWVWKADDVLILIHRFRRLHRLQWMCGRGCEICQVKFPATCCVKIDIIIYGYPVVCRGVVH
jgi:hypothetical protein